MSEERVIVISVVQQQLSKAETARRYQVWRCVHILVTRYQTGGWEAVEPRSRRPHNNSRAVVAAGLRERICMLRCELQTAGLDQAHKPRRPRA